MKKIQDSPFVPICVIVPKTFRDLEINIVNQDYTAMVCKVAMNNVKKCAYLVQDEQDTLILILWTPY